MEFLLLQFYGRKHSVTEILFFFFVLFFTRTRKMMKWEVLETTSELRR